MSRTLNRRIARSATALLLAALSTASVTACSGSESSPKVSLAAAASSMTPASDGFAFANFGSANTKEVMNGEDMRLMFGDSVCSNASKTPCKMTAEAAAWAQMVNQSRQSGHCEGMVVQAASRFDTSASPKTSVLKNSGDTTHGIIRAFATQFFPGVKKETDDWATKSLSEILAALGESFASGKVTYTLGLYSDQGGHAVLPLSVEYPDTNTAKLHIYDTNWPGVDRYVIFNLKKKEWRFSFSGADQENDPNIWTGGEGEIDLASLETRTSADIPFGTTAGSVQGNFLVIRSTSLNWKVSTAQGEISSSTTNSSVGTAQQLRSSAGALLPEYVVTTSATDVKVSLPDASSAYVVSPKRVVHLVTAGSSAPLVVTNSSVAIDNSSSVLSVATGNLAATVKGVGSTVTTTVDKITVGINDANKSYSVDASNPYQTFSASGTKVVVADGSDIISATSSLPTELIQPSTKPGLTPQEERVLSAAPSTTTTTSTSTTIATTNSSGSTSKSTTTTVQPTATTVTAPQTTVAQSNIVALQYTTNGGNVVTIVNGNPISTLSFKLINTNNQWDTSGTGDCSVTLLPELNGGSLNGASLSGTMGAPASGGICNITGLVVNGTSGVKYRLRVSLSNSTATTTLGPFTLY